MYMFVYKIVSSSDQAVTTTPSPSESEIKRVTIARAPPSLLLSSYPLSVCRRGVVATI